MLKGCFFVGVASNMRGSNLKSSTDIEAHRQLDKLQAQFGGDGHSAEWEFQTNTLRDLVKDADVYCEIGFNAGHSAATALQANDNIKVHAFDIGGQKAANAYNVLSQRYPQRIQVTWGDSTQTLRDHPPLGCDVFFIDGGHDKQVAASDIKNVKRHMKKNGIVMMDDVDCTKVKPWCCTGPTEAWQEELQRNQDYTEIHRNIHPDGSKGFAVAEFHGN
jgi:predicted O-methyltransferase YrrM